MTKKKLETIERLKEENETRNFYKETEWFRKGYQPRLTSYKDKSGKTLIEEKDVAEKWTEYFK